MARYYRRRYRTIVRAPRKKWGSNMINIEMQIESPTTGVVATTTTLAENKTETTAPTPVIVKTGNFRMQGDLYIAPGNLSATVTATLYIMYVPQGIAVNTASALSNLVNYHPEWILGWRVLEGGTATSGSGIYDSNRFTVSSRLKRNLNSGDGVYAILIVDDAASGMSIRIKGKCQFWTCAN